MHLISLSGENLKLASTEAANLLNLSEYTLKGNLLFCTIPSEKMQIVNRLAYAKKLYEILYVTTRKNLEASLEAYPWSNIYEKSFCIRMTSDEHYDERYYAGFVWKSLEKSLRPKVNLDNPGLFIEIFVKGNKATVARLLYQNFETFEDRKAHLRPVLHPTAMHPKMARALINILNPTPKEKIIDPFCGACGILTEAGLLGIKFEGYDIDKKILEDAEKNMEHYDIKPSQYSLMLKDSTTTKNLKNIVTDLPYGKSSKKSHNLIELYSKFLKNLSGKAVIVMPNFMPYKQLLTQNLPKTLCVIDIIDQYVHKSLTRKIVIIDKKRSRKKVQLPASKVSGSVSRKTVYSALQQDKKIMHGSTKKLKKPTKSISKNKITKNNKNKRQSSSISKTNKKKNLSIRNKKQIKSISKNKSRKSIKIFRNNKKTKSKR